MSDTEETVRKLAYNPLNRVEKLRELPLGERSAVFGAFSPYVQQAVLQELKDREVVELLDSLDMRQAERILARLHSRKRREIIIRRLKGDIKEKSEYFLRFHPQASLALINFNYLILDGDLTIGKAADIIDDHYDETGKFPEILIHEKGALVGEVPLSILVRERNSSNLRRYVKAVTTIPYHSDVPKIINTITDTKAKKVVVLDRDDSVLGIIYSDSVKPLFGNLPAETLYDFAGVDDSERPFDSIATKVHNRYRWLILNLATSFMAGFVVLMFQDTLNVLAILSIYIPIIAGMGGNAATQSFAIMVRGLTLGTVSLETSGPVIYREMIAGIINGVIIGCIVALISLFWNGEALLGVAVGVALVCAHTIAAIAGTLVPLLMKHFGKDPASTSTIFITTVTDVFGLIFLFGFATLFLL